MDTIDFNITLNLQAKNILFQHYKKLRRIFSDVMGQLELDYISIALLSSQHELLLFSSRPAIDHNLIEKNLWKIDPVLQPSFFKSDNVLFWDKIYKKTDQNFLHYYRLENPGLKQGVSISTAFREYRVSYSFALRCSDKATETRFTENSKKLLSLGQYCLQHIWEAIPLSHTIAISQPKKPHLKLIINKEHSPS